MLFASCGGRQAHPVASYIAGDEKKSCMVLKAEMAQIEAEIANKLPKSDKTLGNVLLGTAGVFLIIPAFFMDLKGAEKIEVEAMQRRYNALSIFAADKGCEISSTTENALADDSPEAKVMQEENAKLRQELKEKIAAASDESDSGVKLNICSNCEHTIGKLEKTLYFEGHLVCRDCYAKLNNYKLLKDS